MTARRVVWVTTAFVLLLILQGTGDWTQSAAAPPSPATAPTSASSRTENPWWSELDWRHLRSLRTTYPAADPVERDRAIKARLKEKIRELDIEKNEFKDVVQFIRDLSGVSIDARWDALAKAGVTPGSLITIKLKDISMEDALPQILAAARPSATLGFHLDDGILIISTQSDLKNNRNRQSPRRNRLRLPDEAEARAPAAVGVASSAFLSHWCVRGGFQL
ncbi:MAG: hypothetical protein ABFD92_20690 [Planctomycetaceae bacterium]